MASRLYLRDFNATSPPSTGDKSTALAAGTLVNGAATNGLESRALSLTKSSSVNIDLSTVTGATQTTHQDVYHARFTSAALSAQTVSANTWTLTVALAEENASANAFLAASLYVWRPGTGAVVGYVYDSDATLGTEFAVSTSLLTVQLVTFSGSAVTAQQGDVLVLELWDHRVQAMNGPYQTQMAWDGTTDATAGMTSDYACYLETPQNLTFYVEGPPVIRYPSIIHPFPHVRM